MIHYGPDEITLFGVDDNGNTFSHTPDQPQYMSMLTTLDQQKQDAIDNQHNVDQYTNALNTYQTALDDAKAQGMSAPQKPMMIVTNDMGEQSTVPFDPPLPDPVLPKITPSSGLIANPIPAADRTDAIIAMLTHLQIFVNQLQVEVAAIKTKVGA